MSRRNSVLTRHKGDEMASSVLVSPENVSRAVDQALMRGSIVKVISTNMSKLLVSDDKEVVAYDPCFAVNNRPSDSHAEPDAVEE